MIITRCNQNDLLFMEFYTNVNAPDSMEERALRIAPLAEAGDALESYLRKYPDDFGANLMLSQIDEKIKELKSI